MERINYPACGGEHDSEAICSKGCGDNVRQEQALQESNQPELARPVPASMLFVRIPAGSFLMGSDSGDSDERPVHRVTISRSFYLQTTVVTQGQWRAVMGDNPSQFNGDDHPVENASWDDVQAFLKNLNALDPGKNYRLPTEAEWEYACLAGTSGEQHGELDAIAWYIGNSDGRTHPVGRKQPNAWGLYDMLGNVCEWCSDWYDEEYYNKFKKTPATDPQGPSAGRYRVLRSCSWDSYDSARSACRNRALPDDRSPHWGFRCARD